MNIVSAKYLYKITDPLTGAVDTTQKTSIQLTLEGGVTKNISIDESRESYQEIMRQVEAGELTIQEADQGSTEGVTPE